MITFHTNTITFQIIFVVGVKVCEPYRESACKLVGKILGKDFSPGKWATKGCYHYETGKFKEKMYFGTGGTLESLTSDPTKSGQFRPEGIDCKTSKNNQIWNIGWRIRNRYKFIFNPSISYLILDFNEIVLLDSRM